MIRRAIRRFAVWLFHTTNYWVVSREVHEAIMRDSLYGRYWATDQLTRAEVLWPGDPEITRARTLLSFLQED